MFRRPGCSLVGALDGDPPAPVSGAAGTSDCSSCLRRFGSVPGHGLRLSGAITV